MTKRQKYKKDTMTKNDKKTKWQKAKKTKKTKKTQKTKRQKDKKTKRHRPKREFNIVKSGQFRTLAMFDIYQCMMISHVV